MPRFLQPWAWMCALIALGLCVKAASDQPTVAFKSDSVTNNEKVGTVSIEVVLSAASSETVTVQYATEDGVDPNGAKSPSDYTANANTLIFPPGSKSQWIQITIVDDGTGENTEHFSITLSNPI